MKPGTSTDLNDRLSFVEGDTWSGATVTITPVPTADLASVKMHFRTDFDSNRTVLKLDSSDATQINITDANAWEFTLEEQNLDLKAGTYVWQIETTDANDVIKTYLEGTIEVYKDVTR